MNQPHLTRQRLRISAGSMAALFLALSAGASLVRAQTPAAPPVNPSVAKQAATTGAVEKGPASEVCKPSATPADVTVQATAPSPIVAESNPAPSEGVVQAACHSCGGGLLAPSADIGSWGPNACGARCYPGRQDCGFHGDHTTFCGRVFGGLYDCLCCPDPCYEPRWLPIADAAFFVDAPRPKTQTRLRADWGLNFQFPDRSEYFWAREGVDQVNTSGEPVPALGKGPGFAERRIHYRQFNYYLEGATGKVGAFVEIPYRSVDPEDPANRGASGFADMNVGTKSLLIDCELLQLAFQFRTYIPIGQAGKGLGTQHVSLEPSLLWALKLAPDTYLQAQTAYWIPIAGDQFYAGDIFHYHLSLNQVLYRFLPDVLLIGTFEVSGWSVLDGAFTDPDTLLPDPDDPATLLPVAKNARGHLMSIGPGLRLDICEKVDIGVGTAFAVTEHHFAEQLYRLEIRWRF